MSYFLNEKTGEFEYVFSDDFMYHVSDTYLGLKPLFEPKVPRNAEFNGEDYTTKRICVSPTIKQCVLGIDGIKNIQSTSLNVGCSWYVYRTLTKGLPAETIYDFETTEEHWIDKTERFQYFGRLCRISDSDLAVFKKRKIIFEFDDY